MHVDICSLLGLMIRSLWTIRWLTWSRGFAAWEAGWGGGVWGGEGSWRRELLLCGLLCEALKTCYARGAELPARQTGISHCRCCWCYFYVCVQSHMSTCARACACLCVCIFGSIWGCIWGIDGSVLLLYVTWQNSSWKCSTSEGILQNNPLVYYLLSGHNKKKQS